MDAIRWSFWAWTSIDAPGANRRIAVSRYVALALALGLAGLAMVIFGRRVSGAFDQSLNDMVFVASVAAAVVWAAGVRLATSAAYCESAWMRRLLDLSPSVALPLLGIALAVAGTSITAILFAAAFVVGEEYWALRFAHGSRKYRAARLTDRVGRATRVHTPTKGDLWQEQRRFRSDDEEIVTGTIRIGVRPGERTVIEHVAFCPPLASSPQLELALVEDSACGVRATHVFRYGARIEVKLERARDEPSEYRVSFEARAALDPKGAGRTAVSTSTVSCDKL
jgi:hypothetical protein